MQTIRDSDTFSAALRSRIAGRVIGPDDADYDPMRAVFRRNHNVPPAR